jgi:hypothetical protein
MEERYRMGIDLRISRIEQNQQLIKKSNLQDLYIL